MPCLIPFISCRKSLIFWIYKSDYSLNLSMLSHIRNGALGPIREWKLKDCITVNKLLETILVDDAAALSKYQN